ncbi:hypothetical protein [Corynebacterium qintianiae]|uniref:hypothetical protein n=1 Tax=Corynebacterium qintianiae TaxID=2709392 RepID=UPI0020177BE6|nr:hypothetical protein [Corynebacterium qintianiae]
MRRTQLCTAATFVAAATLVALLTACAPEAGVTPLDGARAQNQARHVSERFESHPVVVDDPYGFETSRLFFTASETVVVADATGEALLRAASLAVTAHAPLLMYSRDIHTQVVEEIRRLGAHTVLTVGNVNLAPTSGHVTVQRDPGGLEALHKMTSLQFEIRDIDEPAGAVAAVADLAGDSPTWLRTADSPATMPGASARPFPLQSRRDADMAPLVVATPRSPIPAVANARSFGASVEVVGEPDPRKSEETLYALAGLDDAPLIALGTQFGSAEDLAQRIMQAEEYY